jgi:hypothetical protein
VRLLSRVRSRVSLEQARPVEALSAHEARQKRLAPGGGGGGDGAGRRQGKRQGMQGGSKQCVGS